MNPFTTIPSIRDGLSYTWLLWNTQRSMTAGDWDGIFHTTLVMYPLGVTLKYDIPFVNSILSYPAYLCCGPVFAYNFLVLVSTIGTFIGFYLFLKYLTASRAGAISGALAFTFSLYRINRLASGHMDLVSTQWIGFFLLFLCRMLHSDRKPRDAVFAAGFLVLQAYTDYRTFAMLGIVFVITLVHFVLTVSKTELRYRIAQVLLWASVVCIGILPLLVLHRGVASIAYSHDLESVRFILTTRTTDLLRLVIPTSQTPVYGGWLSYLLAGMAIWHLLRRGKLLKNIWFAVGSVFLIISMGFVIRISSWLLLFQPLNAYLWIFNIPILRFMHVPNRFILGVLISLAVGVAYQVARMERKISNQLVRTVFITVVGCGLVLQNTLVGTYRTTELRRTVITDYLEANPEGAVLAVPHGYYDALRMLPGDEAVQERAMFLQILHRRPIVGGYLSYVDDRVYQWHMEQGAFRQWAVAGNAYQDQIRDSELLQELRTGYGIRFIWIQDTGCDGKLAGTLTAPAVLYDGVHGECLLDLALQNGI